MSILICFGMEDTNLCAQILCILFCMIVSYRCQIVWDGSLRSCRYRLKTHLHNTYLKQFCCHFQTVNLQILHLYYITSNDLQPPCIPGFNYHTRRICFLLWSTAHTLGYKYYLHWCVEDISKGKTGSICRTRWIHSRHRLGRWL